MQKEIGNSINSPLAKRVRQAEFALLSTGIVALSFIFAKGIKDSELEDTGIKFASASNSRQIEKKESQISSSSEFTQLPTVEKIEKMYEFMTTSQNPYLRVDAINFKDVDFRLLEELREATKSNYVKKFIDSVKKGRDLFHVFYRILQQCE